MSAVALLRLLVSTALVSATLAVVAGFGSPATAARASCGDVEPYYYNIRTAHVPCKRAKKVAKDWADAALYGEAYIHTNVRVDGFRCHYTATSHVRCRDGGKRVRFLFASM